MRIRLNDYLRPAESNMEMELNINDVELLKKNAYGECIEKTMNDLLHREMLFYLVLKPLFLQKKLKRIF